ncbi:hypothetical protein CJF42_06000, partial [Pseudoalteromonas sp. NBT06-2]|uniref:Hpt domain-containing protein n=1 Tax=Pseudoalteromonas sp. NBT06-2 TaxID=2025950 RepID=UPI000BCC3193
WINSVENSEELCNKTVEKQEDIDFSMLKHLDIETSLERCQYNNKLFKNLLIKFLHNNINFIAGFKQLQSNGNNEDLHNLVHDIKGASGNIGATELHSALIALDQAGSNTKKAVEVVERELQILMSELKVFENNIVDFQPSVETVKVSSDNDMKKLLAGLMKLRIFIEDSDIAAIDQLHYLQLIPVARIHKNRLLNLEAMLDELDFEQANNLTSTLIQEFKKYDY